MSRGRRLAYAAIIVVAAVVLDQASKEWALNKLESGRVIDVLPHRGFHCIDLSLDDGTHMRGQSFFDRNLRVPHTTVGAY